MKDPKLIELLKSLQKKEWTALDKYLKGHYSVDSDNYRIFQALQKTLSKSQDTFDLSILKKKHFPQMSDKGFSNMLSRVNVLVEDWMVSSDVLHDPYKKDLQLIRSYNQRGLYKRANQLYQKIEKQWTAETLWDLETNQALAALYHLQYYSDNPIKYKEGVGLLDKLVKSYVNQLVDQCGLYQVEMFNWGHIQSHDFLQEINMIKELRPLFPATPNAVLLDLLLRVVEHEDTDALTELIELLYQNKWVMSGQLHVLMTSYCRVYAVRLYKAGKFDLDSIYTLYDYCFETRVLLTQGKMPEIRFMNIISTIGASKTIDVLFAFVDKWVNEVDTPDPIQLANLAKAEVYVHQGVYNEIIPLIRELSIKEISLRTKAMCIECIALFKADDPDETILMNKIHNSKRFLRRHKSSFSNTFYEACWNLVTIISLLVKTRYNHLTIDISKYKHLLHRRWVTNQLIKKG